MVRAQLGRTISVEEISHHQLGARTVELRWTRNSNSGAQSELLRSVELSRQVGTRVSGVQLSSVVVNRCQVSSSVIQSRSSQMMPQVDMKLGAPSATVIIEVFCSVLLVVSLFLFSLRYTPHVSP